MLIRLSKNTFVRNYGDFTYIFNKLNNCDEIFAGAEIFMRWITREPREKAEILENIRSFYGDAAPGEIADDFEEFLASLLASGAVLSGNTPAELDAQEISFSYGMKDPKTERVSAPAYREGNAPLTQSVLKQFFEEHPTLFDLQLDITQACTERCVHCYIPDHDALFLPFEKICEVVDEFRDMGGLHAETVGEKRSCVGVISAGNLLLARLRLPAGPQRRGQIPGSVRGTGIFGSRGCPSSAGNGTARPSLVPGGNVSGS